MSESSKKVVSFSFGQTSGYMLRRLMDANPTNFAPSGNGGTNESKENDDIVRKMHILGIAEVAQGQLRRRLLNLN